MTADEALLELTRSTADAVAGVLRMFLPDGVELGEPVVLPAGTAPLEGVPVPGVAAEVTYTDGASGGNVFVTSVTGVRRLAAAMMGAEPADSDEPLDELEHSAVAEAMNQMMAAAAGATASVLGQEVEISTPDVRDLATDADAAAIGADAPHATRVPIVLAGESAVLVQLVPRAFVVKMTRALDDRAASDFTPDAGTVPAADGSAPDRILRGIDLRVSAEIGRTELPLADAVAVPPGGVLELDRSPEDPVDLLVNGRRFATGRLVLVDGEWAVRIEEVHADLSDLPHTTLTLIERS